MRVPTKPKGSPLLLPEEQAILNDLIAPLFGKTTWEEDYLHWDDYLLATPFKTIKEDLVALYRKRAEYVRAFAELTTKRLQSVRSLIGPTSKDKRKKDVTTAEVANLILQRQKAWGTFAQEILSLDPSLTSFLGMRMTGLNVLPDSANDTGKARMNCEIDLKILLIEKNLYGQLEKTVAQATAFVNDLTAEKTEIDNRKAVLQVFLQHIGQKHI